MTRTISSHFAALLPALSRRLPVVEQSIDTRQVATAYGSGWLQALLRLVARPQRDEAVPGIQLLDRLSLGGKRALLLISVGGRQILVGIGEDGPPSIAALRFSDSKHGRSSGVDGKQQARRGRAPRRRAR